MKRPSDQLMMIMWAAVVVLATVIGGASGRIVNVGDVGRWSPHVNFTEWASQQQIYVGDWLRFEFNRHRFDVMEVNQTGYETCNNTFMIANPTRGNGRDVYQVKEARPYYFICTKGYCDKGMKVVINVTLPELPLPSPSQSDASSSFYGRNNKNVMHMLLLATSVLLAGFMAV